MNLLQGAELPEFIIDKLETQKHWDIITIDVRGKSSITDHDYLYPGTSSLCSVCGPITLILTAR